MRSLLTRATDNPDIALAALGCVLAIPLAIYFNVIISDPVYAPIPVVVFLSCLAYLLIRRRSTASVKTQAQATPRMYLLLNISFFCLLIYSIIAFHLRPELYTRPLGYLVATAAMAGVLAIEILFLPSRKGAIYFVLLKIVIISLSLCWSQLFLYPTLVAHDPWYHQDFTEMILNAGHIPAGYMYSELPGMHLVVGGTSLITGLEYKMAAMLSVSLLQVVCSILFIFLLGKFIHSARVGLLAALALGVADWHIMYAYNTIPMGMAVIFVLVIAYLLFKLREESPKKSIGLSILFMVATILTHSIAALMLAMLLFFIWLGAAIHRRLRHHAMAGARVFLVAAILFTGTTLIYSTFVSGQISHIIGFGQTLPSEYSEALLPEEVAPPPEEFRSVQVAATYYRNHVVPVGEHLFNNLGFFLFVALAFVGAFTMFSKEARNRYGFVLITASLLILVFNFIFWLPFQPWIAGRFNFFLQILLAMPLGIALLWLGGLPARRIGNACLIGTVVFSLSFLMVMSLQANMDNRIFSPNTIVRYALTESEAQAFDTVSTVCDGQLGIDDYNIRAFRLAWAPNREIFGIDAQLVTKSFTNCQDMLVLIRQEIVINPFRTRYGVFRLNYDPREALTQQGFSKIYDSGSVSGFIK